VAVPWQGSLRIGLCVSIDEAPAVQSLELREVVDWLDDEPFLTASAPALLVELAAYSGTPAGPVLSSLCPLGFQDDLLHEVRLAEGVEWGELSSTVWLPAGGLEMSELEHLRQQGLIHERASLVPRTQSRLVAVAADAGSLKGAARANQRIALEHLIDSPSASAAELARSADVPVSSVSALVRKGLAEYRDLPAEPAELPLPPAADAPLAPTGVSVPAAARVHVVGGLRRERLAAVLPLLREEIRQGRTPLLLAPELAWLNEAVSFLQLELPVLLLTGDLPDAARQRIWQEVADETPVLLAGTYLALLAPVRNPGLIVLLEAGSSSYKLPAGARLFIPEAARRLAALEGRNLLLTDVSETAEMRVSDGELVQLPYRQQRVFASNMNSVNGWPLGTDLVGVLRQVQQRERQALLLSSRRGFSGALSCSACGHQCMCPHCDLTLRYYQSDRLLRCHQCNHQTGVPRLCPSCAEEGLRPTRAAGTQWVAEAVQRVLPGFPVLRLDSDRQDDLAGLQAGEPGVLVATTAVLRLPPLPAVSLVGLTLLDSHTAATDFRAEEDTLRLLLQLPELSVRSRPLVLVQTFNPGHKALQALRADDVEASVASFTGELTDRRKAFGYPPFQLLAKVQLSARQPGSAELAAERLVEILKSAGATDPEVMGPAPAPVARVRGQFVQLVYVRAADGERFRELLTLIPRTIASARIKLDVDPRDVTLYVE
jgi:primosomal protein N' (replication factor Y)